MSGEAPRDGIGAGSPRVSVVVPVRNRRRLLERLLGALDAQTWRDFEVVVVDDGSTDGADRAAAGSTVAGRPVRVLRSTGGAVAARAVGVADARGDILAFTDSDCIPVPRWIEAAVAAIDSGYDLVNGLTLPERAPNPLERTMASGREGLYPTANMFFRRQAFEAVGGFDPSARHRLGFRHDELARGTGFGEDTILAWRMIRHGHRAIHEPAAEVRHHVFPPDLEECLRRAWQTAAFPALVREVPETAATMLRYRVLFGRRSRVPFYATAAAVAVGRRRLIAGCLAWWAARRAWDMRAAPAPWARKAPLVPAEMLVDCVAGTAMVVGSIRARRVAL